MVSEYQSKTTPIDYSTVTELAGAEISGEQLMRLCHRYYWAQATIGSDKDIIECACGTGPGLGYLAKKAKSVSAGDYTQSIIASTHQYYRNRIDLLRFDAAQMPYRDQSVDVVILFEAIYYLPDVEQFVRECRRVLRPGGQALIATANKDLYDFNPSPHSHVYYGVVELQRLFAAHGFSADCFGFLSVRDVSWRQRVLRPAKKFAVNLNLMPGTANGKKWLKRIVFGNMTEMPSEIEEGMIDYTAPTRLDASVPNSEFKVIYCKATLSN